MNSKDITLSANTLFHFTDKLENLEGILSSEFFPRYSIEDNIIVPDNNMLGKNRERAIPMVCFCDTPLSQIKNHVKYYGYYAIGLDKKWGMKSKISPVLYTYRDSLTGDSLYNGLRKVIELREAAIPKWIALGNLIKFLNFVKPYEGKLWRKDKYIEGTVRFYDEREWRYVPNLRRDEKNNEEEPVLSISKDDFINERKRKEHNKKLEKFKLSFEPKDIKYIIVKKENERLKMAEAIKRIKGKFEYNDVQTLITRIISMEQIMDDF